MNAANAANAARRFKSKRFWKRALVAVIGFDSWTKNFFLGGGRW